MGAPPVAAGPETRRGDVADAVRETSAIVGQQDDRASRQACNVASSARTGQPLHLAVAVTPGTIQVAEAIDFRSTQKTDMDTSLLEKAHDVKHLPALRSAQNIGGIAHGAEKLG